MNPAQFTVDSRLDGDTAVIYPKGYLNNLTGESLVIECGRYTDKGIRKIVLNFGGTGLINSIGISLLLQIIEDLRTVEGTVCFSDMSKFQIDTLDMLGLLKHLLIFPVESDALRYLGAGSV
ncbi:MAG: STAS domain-containing protein [Thermodesulfovibrionales bacterium]